MAADIMRFAAIGDSIMWGQGLERKDTFVTLASDSLARALKKNAEVVAFTARSGARLMPGVKPKEAGDDAVVLVLPGNKEVATFLGDRYSFVDRYFDLFTTAEEVLAFLDDNIDDQRVASRLYGDIPATFPTVGYQIRSIDSEVAKSVDLLFLNGSANDIDFEKVMHPDGPSLEDIDRSIESHAYVRLKETLRSARKKFPNALIVCPGYPRVLTEKSNKSRIEQFFKHLSDFPSWKLVVNDFLEHPIGKYSVGLIVDPWIDTAEEKVDSAIARTHFGFTRGIYWMRRAIYEENLNDKPGMLYVNPQFTDDNGFAGKIPLVHEGYLNFGGDKDVRYQVNDKLLNHRMINFERIRRHPEMNDLRKRIANVAAAPEYPRSDYHGKLRDELLADLRPALRAFRNSVRAPQSLRVKINAICNGEFEKEKFSVAIRALDVEASSLKHAYMASLLHPNESGAKQYSKAILERYFNSTEHQLRGITSPRGTASYPKGGVSLRLFAKSRGFDPALGLIAVAEHKIIDSVAVRIFTGKKYRPISFQPIGYGPCVVNLQVNKGTSWTLSNPFGQFRKDNEWGLFTLLPPNRMALGQVEFLAVHVRNGGLLQLKAVEFCLNGRRVFYGQFSEARKVTSGLTASYFFPYPR